MQKKQALPPFPRYIHGDRAAVTVAIAPLAEWN